MGVKLIPTFVDVAKNLGDLDAEWAGQHTPTNRVREVERVAVQHVDATGPDLRAAIVGIAAKADLIPVVEAEEHMPDGTDSHRAEAAEPTVIGKPQDDSPVEVNDEQS